MGLLVILGIAVGLAADAFAVAVGASAGLGRVTRRQVFRLGFHFGLFQAVMPLVGWLAGQGLEQYIAGWDHWVAFGLLGFIGGKAVVTAVRSKPQPSVGRVAPGPPRRGQEAALYNGATPARAVGDEGSVEQQPGPVGPGKPPARDPTRGLTLLMLSVATSIDALAVGLTLGVLEAGIWLPVLIIGVVTAGLTTLGMLLGSRIGARFGRWAEFFGGLVLIGIGVKILVEHLT